MSMNAWVSAAAILTVLVCSGMQHCVGGPGTDRFDALAAMEQWVEHGRPSDRISAAHIDGGKSRTHAAIVPLP